VRRLVFLELDERDARGLLGRVEYRDVLLPFKYDGVVLAGRMWPCPATPDTSASMLKSGEQEDGTKPT
jgi:hypothetical protein